MSKKFVVNVDSSTATIEDVKKTLTGDTLFYFDKSCFEVTELPEPPEVKMVEMGVLNLPNKEYCLCRDRETFIHNSTVNLTEYPELKPLCKDIETTWDFNSIPVGSLVEVIKVTGVKGHGLFERVNLDYLFYGAYQTAVSDIKSIRIVEGAK